jgi:hypothetical protein
MGIAPAKAGRFIGATRKTSPAAHRVGMYYAVRTLLTHASEADIS